MTVILREHIPGGELAILDNPGPAEGPVPGITQEDLVSASRFTNPRRRGDHLWARAALRSIIPDARITYGTDGAPILERGAGYGHAGFSHCRGAAAAIVSQHPCAVDIENLGCDFSRASSKFVSQAERGLPGAGDPLFIPTLWCTKEALYKYARIPGLDFLRDLKVTAADLSPLVSGGRGELTATIRGIGPIAVTVGASGVFILIYLSVQVSGRKKVE
ncbi:MAG: siderophore synthetase phosphopantetheinyl transferase subunit [Rikenellaceae bacterium]|nr:siderophore synthetase phosphopantetheinyl transferase subunit [Rikenellaceae bacterium]